jgi:hypothetical protein
MMEDKTYARQMDSITQGVERLRELKNLVDLLDAEALQKSHEKSEFETVKEVYRLFDKVISLSDCRRVVHLVIHGPVHVLTDMLEKGTPSYPLFRDEGDRAMFGHVVQKLRQGA